MCSLIALDYKLSATPFELPDNDTEWHYYIQGVEKDLRSVLERLADNGNADEWRASMDRIIREIHPQSHFIGQVLSGFQAIESVAEEDGLAIADVQSSFANNFYIDLLNGRYGQLGSDDFNQDWAYSRMRMYLNYSRATAALGFVTACPDTTEFDWVMTAKEHCEDCPILADGGPYTKDSLYTVPGECRTPCMTNCGCILRISGTEIITPMPFAA